MARQEAYNPEIAFDQELEKQKMEGVQAMEMTVEEKIAWSFRSTNEHAQAAANISLILNLKAQKATEEIKQIRNMQTHELKESERQMLLEIHRIVLSSIQARAQLALDMSTLPAPEGTNDDMVSSESEIPLVNTFNTLLGQMDVEYLVYEALPEPLKKSYLESVGRSFKPDFNGILEKVRGKKELGEAEWQLLESEVVKLGEDKTALERSAVILVFGALDAKQRMELGRRLLAHETPNVEAQILEMTRRGYLKTVQAVQLIDERLANLEAQESGAKRREAKDLEGEMARLKVLRAEIGSKRTQAVQAETVKHNEEAAKFYRSRQYGHKNRARELLTVKGIGSALLTLNGAMTVFANVAMNATDPLSIPFNSMVWLGAAEMAAGLELSGGHGGIVPTPRKLVGRLLKDENERRDDQRDDYQRAFEDKLNNNPQKSAFYYVYAERIVTVYKAKKTKNPYQEVRVSLADIGINKKEDLPPRFQELWEEQGDLTDFINNTVAQFSRVEGDKGMKTTEYETQRKFIQDARTAVGVSEIEPIDLPIFEYKE